MGLHIMYLSLIYFCIMSGKCSEPLCKHQGQSNGLPICTSAYMTGSWIPIDTSKVQQNKSMECYCTINIDTNASIGVFYEVLVGKYPSNCALSFQAGDTIFSCENAAINPLKDFRVLQFSKTAVEVDACLVLYVGDSLSTNTSQGTAAVTCYETDVSLTTTGLVKSPIIQTFYPSISSKRISASKTPMEMTTTFIAQNSVYDRFPHSTFKTTDDGIKTSADEQTTSPIGLAYSSTVTIVAAAGGGGACILVVGVILICYCYRRPKRKAPSNLTDKHGYVNTAPEPEITENVLYNIEFPFEPNQDTVQANALEDIHISMTDKNETKRKKSSASVTYKTVSLEYEAGTYDNVKSDDTQELKTNAGVTKSPIFSRNNPSNKMPEHEMTSDEKGHLTTVEPEQFMERYITNSIHDRNLSAEAGANCIRPTQIQAPESDDTYAVVDK